MKNQIRLKRLRKHQLDWRSAAYIKHYYAQQLNLYSLKADMGELHLDTFSSCIVIEKAIVKNQSTLKQSTIDG